MWIATSFLILIIYSGFLIWMTMKIKGSHQPKKRRGQHSFSIIIPFRNEGQSLIELVKNLNAQLSENDELILVDDHSESETVREIQNLCANSFNCHYHQLRIDEKGKKSATEYGFHQSKNEILLFLDGDVMVSRGWLEHVKAEFNQVDLLILPVLTQFSQHVFGKIEITESTALLGTTMGFANAGNPIMMNGAGYAIGRSDFEQFIASGLGRKVSSGDDIFLLHFMRKLSREIAFSSNGKTVVKTSGNGVLQDYLNQRRRWASKMIHETGLPGRSTGIFILFFQVCFIASILGFFFSGALGYLFLFWLMKGCFEYYFTLTTYSRFSSGSWLNNFSFTGPLLYPFISTFIVISSLLSQPVWKDRRVVIRPE